ncbi:MAG: ABC transporter substrate-binding protein [Dehalococcoidia bacterium]
MRRRKFLGTAGMTAAGLATLVACGGDEDDSTSPQTAAQTSVPSDPNQAGSRSAGQAAQGQWEGLKRGGTYVAGGVFSNDPPSLDPYAHLSFLAQYIGVHSYGRLLKFKTGPGVTPLAEIIPDLAEKYELTDNAQTWVITLRPGVKFHNKPPLNGRELTMEDVSSSYERFRAQSPNSGSLAFVDRIETPDTRTLVFKLKHPYAPFDELLASPNGLWVMSKEANSGQIDPAQIENVIGTGPWVLDQYRPSSEISFAGNTAYYEKISTPSGDVQLPIMERLRYPIISEYAQLLAQFVAGESHAFTPRNADAASTRDRVSGVQADPSRPGWLWSGFSFNQESNGGLLKDPRVRRAWSMALDRDGLIEAFAELRKMRSQGFDVESGWSNSPIPWGDGGLFWWLDPKSSEFGPGAQWYQFNPGEAKKLLEAAGYNGDPIDMNFVVGTYGTTYEQFTEAQLPMLKEVGLNINPKVWEYRRMIGSQEGKEFPGTYYNYNTPFTTVDEYVFNSFHPDVGDRGAPLRRINTPEIIALVDKQRLETDRQARQKQIHEIQRLAGDLMTSVPTVYSRWGTVAMVQPSVRNAFNYQTAGYGFAAEEYVYRWLDR